MKPEESLEHQWSYLLSFLPEESVLEETARLWGAIRRRREVGSASDLLRLSLVYGFCGLSLRQAAAWAEAAEVASLSDVALLKRLRKASDWLGHLLAIKLGERVEPLAGERTRLRLIDATAISAPGSTGTDWRVHLDFDVGAQAISEIQVTPVSGGESLFRYDFDPGELVVADRGYSNRPGLAHVIDSQSHFIVRLNPASVPLQMPGGAAFDLLSALRNLPEAEARAFELEIQPNPQENITAIPVRLVAVRKSEEAAEQTRKKLLAERSRRGKEARPQTLEMANYVLVLTSTTGADFSPEQILEIYRFRWQIELVFKRLKSLLRLHNLPAKTPELARTFLLAKLLGALLLEELTHHYLSFSPWGFRLRDPSAALIVADPTNPAR